MMDKRQLMTRCLILAGLTLLLAVNLRLHSPALDEAETRPFPSSAAFGVDKFMTVSENEICWKPTDDNSNGWEQALC